jgi:DNA-binding transcriptional LysR family regulator
VDWDDLRYVLAVGRHTTLAAAARELRVDSTTVGRKLVAIEEQLGTRLFERTADGFVPTQTGEIAIARATEVELQTLALEREIAGRDARAEGPVRLTAVDAFFDGFLIAFLPRLWARHPALELTLVSDIRLFDLSRREADVGIRYKKPKDPNLVGRRLGTQASALYAARELVVGDAPPLIGFPAELDATQEARTLVEHFPNGRVVARANTGGHMFGLARAGAGIALLDCYAADLDPALRRVVPEPVLTDELWAVVHVDMHKAARVRAVMDFLAEIVAEEAARLAGHLVPNK